MDLEDKYLWQSTGAFGIPMRMASSAALWQLLCTCCGRVLLLVVASKDLLLLQRVVAPKDMLLRLKTCCCV